MFDPEQAQSRLTALLRAHVHDDVGAAPVEAAGTGSPVIIGSNNRVVVHMHITLRRTQASARNWRREWTCSADTHEAVHTSGLRVTAQHQPQGGIVLLASGVPIAPGKGATADAFARRVRQGGELLIEQCRKQGGCPGCKFCNS